EPVADPRGLLAVVRIDQLHVAHVDRGLLVRDAAFLGTPLPLVADLLVLRDHVDPLDQDLAPVRVGRDDQTGASPVPARDHDHVVTLLDLHLEHLRRQRDDPHEALLPQLATDRAEDARAPRVTAVPDQHRRVLVEADIGAIAAAALLAGAHHDRLDDIALLHAGAGKGILHGRHDDVTDARVSPAAAAEHTDAEDLLCTRVVGDLEPRLLLDHVNSVGRWPASGPGFTSLSPGSPRPASAWSRTAAWSPSAGPGRRRRRRWRRRGPCTSSCGGCPCRTWGASPGPRPRPRRSCPSCR